MVLIPANRPGFKTSRNKIVDFFLLNSICDRYVSPTEAVTNAKLYFCDKQLSENTEIHSSLILQMLKNILVNNFSVKKKTFPSHI